jgi:hypothetical protein
MLTGNTAWEENLSVPLIPILSIGLFRKQLIIIFLLSNNPDSKLRIVLAHFQQTLIDRRIVEDTPWFHSFFIVRVVRVLILSVTQHAPNSFFSSLPGPLQLVTVFS